MDKNKDTDKGHWNYPGNFDINEWFGFIYRIINNKTNQEYIGKKQFFTITRKKVKGRKNRKIVKKESNWKIYTGSSAYLNDDISKYGKDNFTFLIESLHTTKASLYYAEIESQINEDVLRSCLPSGDKKFYNKAIGNIKFIPPDEDPNETRHKIRITLKEFWRNTDHHYYNQMSDEEKVKWDSLYRIGNNSNEEKWLDNNLRGENNPMFGISGENSPTYGEICTEEKIAEWKDNIGNAVRGVTRIPETKKKMAATKRKPQDTVTCPHCGKSGGKSNMTRYHFDNCKNK
jgi:hypothetical protein